MSNHQLKEINEAAVLIANDVRSGNTVYLTPGQIWSESRDDALILSAEDDLQHMLDIAHDAEAANEVVGAYAVDTDKQGYPTHIRERLRVDGPSIAYTNGQ